jgi:hypothetical protein
VVVSVAIVAVVAAVGLPARRTNVTSGAGP